MRRTPWIIAICLAIVLAGALTFVLLDGDEEAPIFAKPVAGEIGQYSITGANLRHDSFEVLWGTPVDGDQFGYSGKLVPLYVSVDGELRQTLWHEVDGVAIATIHNAAASPELAPFAAGVDLRVTQFSEAAGLCGFWTPRHADAKTVAFDSTQTCPGSFAARNGSQGTTWTNGQVTLTYDTGVSMPVRIAGPGNLLWPGAGSSPIVLELTGYDRPDAEPIRFTSADGELKVPISSRRTWGPNQVDVGLPIDYDDAYRKLVTNHQYRSLEEDKPGLYIGSAWPKREATDTGYQFYWSLTATDGKTHHTFRVDGQSVDAAGNIVPPRDQYPRVGLVKRSMPEINAIFAALEDAPTEVWDYGRPDWWGFDITCIDPQCRASGMTIAAGSQWPRLEETEPVLAAAVFNQRGVLQAVWKPSGDVVAPTLPAAPEELPAIQQWLTDHPEQAIGVGLSSLIVAGLFYIFSSLKFVGFGLYSRVREDQLLLNATRQRIHDAIEENPGAHARQLSRTVGCGRSTFDHHVRKLVAAGLVQERATGGYTCYFPPGRVDRPVMQAARVLKADGARQVLHAIGVGQADSVQEIAGQTGLGYSTVTYHLRQLERHGLVMTMRRGRRRAVLATEVGRQALETLSAPIMAEA